MSQLIEIEDFLSIEECNQLINLIDLNNQVSEVSENYSSTINSNYRTSSTSHMDPNNPSVFALKNKISDYIKIPVTKAEHLQGQKYQPGQFFKHHNDAFSGSSYQTECLHSGNRTHTFMIYLNDVENGGETYFHNLNKKIKPKAGKAVFWPNLKNGEVDTQYLHEGSEVTKGVKYIITSWWRERDWNGTLDKAEFSKKYSKPFSNYNELPQFSELGFKVVKCPENTWKYIQNIYNEIKIQKEEETFNGKQDFIKGEGITSEIIPIHGMTEVTQRILHELKPLHEEFAKTELEDMCVYGIRSYLHGATLKEHRDRIETHHISSILIVDTDLNGAPNWPLDIQDNKGKWQKIYAQSGDLIIYESAKCEHGRHEPFQGNWFRNMFIHYKLKDYQFIA